MSIELGALHVVATPIGNRDDLTARARAVLAGVDVVAAEDTRHTGRLLKALGIDATLVSLHEHNEAQRIPALLERLRAGAAVALVSDAGTPGISDPGYPLVTAAHEAGLRVIPIPGPSAVLAALSTAGQPTDRFVFEGFLPGRGKARRERLEALAGETRTLVLLESGHRIAASLRDMAAVLGGGRCATFARELTKAYETLRRARLEELAEWVEADADQRRGEIVVVVAGATAARSVGRVPGLAETLDALLAELPPGRAAAVAARLTGASRREAYEAALARGGSGSH